ncbi:hypothetical protein [Leifsonia sp. Leaf264]|uniref:hypothetical protein n=1 Tax=Leifsonia sp. Leaf264 TaxID=1736314 RepID=UPI000A92C67E|nr:hypothetical protein [Leifsonia sp. Leaf264]
MATAVVAGIIVVWALVASGAAMLIGGVIGRADREECVVVEPHASAFSDSVAQRS